MDFDDSAADQLIAACNDASRVLGDQRGPRASVTGEALEEFRGPFAVLFQQNAAAQVAARNILIGALEDLIGQVHFAKAQAEQARQDLKDQQAKALWCLTPEGIEAGRPELVTGRPDYMLPSIPEFSIPGTLSKSEVRRPEVVFPPITFEPHNWASSGGSGTTSAVPDTLRKAASLVLDQHDAADLVCQDVVHALNHFQGSCSWAMSDVGTFAPAVAQFNQDDRDDAGKLSQIGEAFSTAGKGTGLSVPVELSATSLALAISPNEVHGEILLKFFASASPLDLEVASKNPGWLTHLGSVSPEQVAKWWAGLHGPGSNAADGYSAQQRVLLASTPKVFGSLDGIPALDRVYANKLAAVEDIAAVEAALATLQEGVSGDPMSEGRREFLAKEVDYLKKVESGEIQMYLYDREKSRIIEMIGTPDPSTQRTITYVPGLFTSPESFYDDGVQQVSRYITDMAPNTVAFVYKDGLFPGENEREGGENFLRVTEANNPLIGLSTGEKLASFQQGMQADPLLESTEQIGIGHSWGYQNLTSSEIFGADYEKSISLAGAGMHEKWVPDADTQYSNYVYKGDALRWAQKTGQVWDGNVPSKHDSFANNEYSAPNDGRFWPDITPIEDHSLIATDSQGNRQVLRDVLVEVMK